MKATNRKMKPYMGTIALRGYRFRGHFLVRPDGELLLGNEWIDNPNPSPDPVVVCGEFAKAIINWPEIPRDRLCHAIYKDITVTLRYCDCPPDTLPPLPFAVKQRTSESVKATIN